MTIATERVLWFFGGLVIGGLAVVFAYQIPADALAPSEDIRTATTSRIGADLSGRVVVNAQPAGVSVIVTAIAIEPPGVWVAVREVNAGELGNVLGAARARDAVTSLSVPLLRATTAGHTYAVVLYRDDGDDAFDHTKDSVYVDFETGKPVVASFTAGPI